MKIKKLHHQHRRDFRATYECEHCKHTEDMDGYDDENFHVNVIPGMKCKECGKTSPEDYVRRATRYPEESVI